jgi:hypothetical protein
MQPPVSVPRFLARQIHQFLSRRCVVIRSWFVTITAAIECDELAGPTLARPESLAGERRIGPNADKL